MRIWTAGLLLLGNVTTGVAAVEVTIPPLPDNAYQDPWLGARYDDERDPLEGLNRAIFRFNFNFGDADGADFDSRDAQPEASGDCVASSSCTARAVGVVDMRYGRLNGRNAYGSELTPLALPLWLEQWNGSRFEVASSDSCTRIDPMLLNANGRGPANLNDIPLVGTGITDLSHRQPVVAGQAGVVLSAPGVGNQGYLLLEIDSSSSLHFLQDKYDGSTRQSLPPLHGAFGRYRGNDRIIYWRESVD